MPCCLLALCVIGVSCRSRQADWLPSRGQQCRLAKRQDGEAGAREHTGCCPPAASPASRSFIPVCGPLPRPLFCSQLTSRSASRFAQHRRARVAARSAGSCRGPVSQQVGGQGEALSCFFFPPPLAHCVGHDSLTAPFVMRVPSAHLSSCLALPCALEDRTRCALCLPVSCPLPCVLLLEAHFALALCAPRFRLVEGACGVSTPGCIQSRR
jgi:hypothetical protein